MPHHFRQSGEDGVLRSGVGHVRWRNGRRTIVVLGGLGMSGVVVALGIANAVLRADMPNASSALALPTWLIRLTEQNSVAYPAHAMFGTLLDGFNLSPSETAVQWFKAAAHAQSSDDLYRAAQGITAALKRDRRGDARRALCQIQGLANTKQVRVLVRTGAWCDDWTPNVDLEANIAPTRVSVGGTVRIEATVTSTTSVMGLVDLEIHDADVRIVEQWLFPDQNLVAEHRNSYAVIWIVPSDVPPGEYTVKLGVFRRGGAVIHGWKNSAANLTVDP